MISEAGKKPLRVCYFGTYRANYSRNQIMIAGLRQAGVAVVECHATLWQGVEDRVQVVGGGWTHPRFWGRVLSAYIKLLKAYALVGEYDIMVVGYPGVLDVFLARILSGIRRKPLVWDVFMSVYLVALERGLDAHSQISVALLRKLERLALRVPDLLIQDTEAYVTWLVKTHAIPAERFRLVPTGADETIFQPPANPPTDDGMFRVIYYGSFIPNHGVEHIIEAAKRLADQKEIQFELIGSGPERDRAIRLAQQYALTNVEFIQWLDQKVLIERVGRAHACLGAFGTTPQSLMTVQNKVYEAMAMAKPLISGDSPAIRKAFEHGEEIWLCRRSDGEALAEAILTLWQNPGLRARLAEKGCRRFRHEYGLEAIGARFAGHLREALR